MNNRDKDSCRPLGLLPYKSGFNFRAWWADVVRPGGAAQYRDRATTTWRSSKLGLWHRLRSSAHYTARCVERCTFRFDLLKLSLDQPMVVWGEPFKGKQLNFGTDLSSMAGLIGSVHLLSLWWVRVWLFGWTDQKLAYWVYLTQHFLGWVIWC